MVWLASHVADNLIANRGLLVKMEDMIEAVDQARTGMIQTDAEHFIERYYFGYPSFDPHKCQLIAIFRRIVKRKLRKHL